MTQIDWCKKYWEFGSLVEAFRAQQVQGAPAPVMKKTYHDVRVLFLALANDRVCAPHNVLLREIVSDMYHMSSRAIALEIH